MTVYEGEHAIYLACRATVLDESHELAWAEKYVAHNPNIGWILGKYVEADRPNGNRQHFTLENMRFGQPSLAYGPTNINHTPMIVGAFVASEILYPETEDADLRPNMDALSVFWKHYYPDEYSVVETAHRAQRLFYSMECLPEELGCVGDGGCGEYFKYEGRQHASYCDHLNDPTSGVIKDLVRPSFTAGALIVPPVRPGWNNATIDQISAIARKHGEVADAIYEAAAEEAPDATPSAWQAVMEDIVRRAVEARKKDDRKGSSKKGTGYRTLPDGRLTHA